jgi:hypothetical protein
MTTTQGRCRHCGLRWVWPGRRPRVREARCPLCGTPLARTSHQCRDVTRWAAPMPRSPALEPLAWATVLALAPADALAWAEHARESCAAAGNTMTAFVWANRAAQARVRLSGAQ